MRTVYVTVILLHRSLTGGLRFDVFTQVHGGRARVSQQQMLEPSSKRSSITTTLTSALPIAALAYHIALFRDSKSPLALDCWHKHWREPACLHLRQSLALSSPQLLAVLLAITFGSE